MRNFHQHLTTGKQPTLNLVDDGWTHAVGMVGIADNKLGPKLPGEIPEYMNNVQALDLPRQDRIRKRVSEVVKDPGTAANLLAWYPTWCKRPLSTTSIWQRSIAQT
jgi:cation diffusion facilitator CzcD-associated flavoprotein CzcO